jgi:repressor LexA
MPRRDPSRRARVLDFIRRFMEERGYAPTIKEIQKGCGYTSPRPVQFHLKVLEKEGLIERTHGMARGISIPGGIRAEVPLLGAIAAGEPIPVPTEDTWESTPLDMVEVPWGILRGRRHLFALKVEGTSMIDALVDDSDIVVLEATSVAEDGEVVAAWLTERQEATLKRLYREPGRIRLQPANRAMAPLYVRPDEIEIQGRVIAVLRMLDRST